MLDNTILFPKGYDQKKVKPALWLDRFLKLFILQRDKRVHSDEVPKKILYIQSHLIGDLVMAIPQLRALKEHYPTSSISLLANGFAKEFINEGEFVDKIYMMKFPWASFDYSIKNLWRVILVIKKLRREAFDLAIDGKIDFRNALLMFLIRAKRRLGYDVAGGGVFLTEVPEFPNHLIHLLETRFSLLGALGVDTSDKAAKITIRKEAQRWVDGFLAEQGILKHKLVAIHPGASSNERFWRAENFAKVINCLSKKGYSPVLVEGPNDSKRINNIERLCNKQIPIFRSSLENMVALLGSCRLVLCIDSACSHLASAVTATNIVLFGPREPHITKPFYEKSFGVWEEDIECRSSCEYLRCKKKENPCMNAINAEDVIEKIDDVLRMGANKAI